MQVRSYDEVHAWDYDPDLLLSEVQIAHMISTGNPPIYSFRYEKGPPKPRTVEQARWELAARLQNERILAAGEAELEQIRARIGSDTVRRSGNSLDFRSRYARDPYYRLSRDELFEMALARPNALDVASLVYEWEHVGGTQRFIEDMDEWVRRLSNQYRSNPDEFPQEFWASRLAMITGASEPSNLHLLGRWDHARTDLEAGRNFIRARLDRYGNRAIPTRREVSRYTYEQRAEGPTGFTFPSGETLGSFPLTDFDRAADAVVGFDQRTLAELMSALQEDEWQNALRLLQDADRREEWNGLVRRLNRQVDYYGMPAALRLPEI
ncbi:hypothetical protein Aple_012570 [Acrocarpospora pleiomorpha]|uniref:Uncharacterized protein n=1 Tax=Acrocarpospora pleiomorpha TaxID=90975 RepID=A0A5M3XC66_9ACTN|nr:hypothetical protein [Acrocarpospora pleiomorpha]GES18362.1 hypothetical protein Aple_012570 [Acrocarpospora pleiomorpha]